MKRYSTGVIMLFSLKMTLLTAQPSLEHYLQVAADNNPGLKARFSEYMGSLEQIPQVGALPDPQLAFAYFIAPVETRMGPQRFRISASQMFPWFGTLQARENAAAQSAKARYETFEEARAKLFHEVRTNYYNLYLNRRALTITRENLDLLSSFSQLARTRIESGMASSLDEYRLEMEIGDLENQLARLVENEVLLKVMFNNLLHVDREQPVETPSLLPETDLGMRKEDVLDTIRAVNPQLRSLALEQEALMYREEVAEKMGKPGFSVGFDYINIGSGPDNFPGTDAFVFPMVGITIPLYRSKYKAMVNETIQLREAKGADRAERTNLLEDLLEKSWNEYQDAGRRIILYQSQMELAKQSMSLLETAYANGESGFEEVLRMERKLLNYRLELERARTDKQASRSFIFYLMGK
jgi:cobalt-zinc-cadmium efflux system outer membrane protein